MGEDFPLDPNQEQPPHAGQDEQFQQEGDATHTEVTSREGDNQLGGVAISAQPDPNRPPTTEMLVQDLSREMVKPNSVLAVNGIDNQIANIQTQIQGNERSIAFTRGYKPRHPGPTPHPEAGGMDHQDYNAELWEYANYDSDDELDKLDARDEELVARIDELERLRQKIENGDATLTEKFSLAEKTRLEAEYLRKLYEADRKVFDYDNKRGAEIVGSRELLTSLESLVSEVGEKGQPNNNDWHHSHYDTSEHDKHALRYKADTFTTDQDGKKITIQVGAKAVPSNGTYYAPPNPDEYTEHLADRLARLISLTIDTPDHLYEGDIVNPGQKYTEFYGFRLYDDGRVAEQAKWNKGYRSQSQIPNILIGIEDIDKIQGYVDSINADTQHEE